MLALFILEQRTRCQMTVQLNAARTFGEPFGAGLEAHQLAIDLSQRNMQERNQIAHALARKLERTYRGIAAVGQEQSRTMLYLVSRSQPKSEEVELKSKGVVLRLPVCYEGTRVLRPDKPWVLNDLLRQSIRTRAREKGFQPGFSAGKYYGGSPKLFIVGEFQEPVYVYEGFRIKTRVYSDGSAL